MQKQVYEFISKQMNDPIIERRTCRRTGEEFAIYQGDVDLLNKISPVIGGRKFQLPLPTLSPLARMRRRMMFRNERGLYTRTSVLSGEKVISMYHEDMVKNVIAQKEMYSDAYRSESYGINYDPQKPFLQQVVDVKKEIPRPGVININNTNGDYNTFSTDSKNIYLCADTMRCEDVLYSTTTKYIKNGVDLLNVRSSDYVCECVSSHHLTKCAYVRYSENCYSCAFLMTCTNCTNCYFCTNINNKQNYVFNKPARPEVIQEIQKKMRSYAGLQELKQMFQKLLDQEPRPAGRLTNCEDSMGSLLNNSKHAFMCYDSHDIENCRYCHVNEFNADVMDCTIFNPHCAQVYEQVCGGMLKKSVTDLICRNSSDIYFSEFVMDSHHMLGCINQYNTEYCILNKKYSPEQREKLAAQIIESLQKESSWGEFFPTEMSPFPYNDTVAMDYFPVTQDQITILQPEKFISDAILNLGGEKIPIKRRTRNYEINIPADKQTIKSQDLPDNIDEVKDDICSSIIICEETGRPYTISPLELGIYRKMGLPLPRIHYSLRHTMRINSRPTKEFFLRTCDKTGEEMLSLYPPHTKFPVYSQAAFEKLLYG